jgi:Fe-S cluster assembly ATP-binding protein
MLKIKNLTATSDSQPLLKNISLEVKTGEIHAIMGPKHSGKSALVHAITGHPSVSITEGTVHFKKKKLNDLEADQRAGLGIFISFQFPPEFESVTNWDLTKEIFSKEKPEDLAVKYNSCLEILNLKDSHGDSIPSVADISMSQAKRNELIYMLLKNPDLVIFDEIDEGLEPIENVLIASILKDFLAEKGKGCIVVTHSRDLLKIIEPTHVHIMVEGEIKVSGTTELYTRIIEDGYPEFS